MMTQLKFFISILLFFLLSCEKKEKPITPYDRGGLTTNQVSVVSNNAYTYQVYFNLSTNTTIKTVDRTIWDLAFHTKEDQIWLNSSNFMKVINTYDTNFSNVSSSPSPTNYDHSSGNVDSLALKDIISNDNLTKYVFVIDRGHDPIPIGSIPDPAPYQRGTKKLQVIEITDDYYKIRYANLSGSNDNTLIIQRDTTETFTHFSFENTGSIVAVAPPKDSWDLIFTRYSTVAKLISTQETKDYLVTGVLINKWQGVKGVKVNDKSYDNISINDLSSYQLSDSLDIIGYDWKLFDDVQDSYSIHPTRNYIIKDQKGFYYKFRFTDFYNNQGERGHASFEFQKL